MPGDCESSITRRELGILTPARRCGRRGAVVALVGAHVGRVHIVRLRLPEDHRSLLLLVTLVVVGRY